MTPVLLPAAPLSAAATSAVPRRSSRALNNADSVPSERDGRRVPVTDWTNASAGVSPRSSASSRRRFTVPSSQSGNTSRTWSPSTRWARASRSGETMQRTPIVRMDPTASAKLSSSGTASSG